MNEHTREHTTNVHYTDSYIESKYGISKPAARYLSRSFWKIREDYLDAAFKTYYILSWQSYYLRDKIKDGQIERDGVLYDVIFYRCNSSVLHTGHTLLLSFRSLKDEFNSPPIVLVTIK